MDWVAITSGEKTEFRRYKIWDIPTRLPRAVIAHSTHSLTGETEGQLIIVEDAWEEPLGVITPESLKNEGYETLGEFRKYFQERYPNLGYRPLDRVWVYKLRPFTEEDRREQADMLFEYLHQEWL